MTNIVNIKKNGSEKLVFEFSNDKYFLQQYSQLVDQYYKKDLNLDLVEEKMDKSLIELNKNEFVYIVRENNRVIAGSKINIVKSKSKQYLPMEEGSFLVSEYIPEDANADFYGEIGRLVMDPTYRGKDILQKMITNLFEFSISQSCNFLFVLAPALNSVLYRRICRAIGVTISVKKDAPIPDKELYRRLAIKLLSCDLRDYNHSEQELKQVV